MKTNQPNNSRRPGTSVARGLQAVAFALILCMALSAFFQVFRFKYGDGIYSLDKFYDLEDDTADVLVLGSSHAFEGINPAVLYSEYGVAAYDLCGSTQPMWNTYHYLVEALKTQTPRLVILEAYCVTFADEYSEESNIVKNTFGLRPSANMLQALKASVPEEEFLEYLFRFYRYHSRYNHDLTKHDFYKNQGQALYADWKGFGCNFEHTSFEMPDVSDVGASNLTRKTEAYYRKIMELCISEGIPLEIIVAPYALDRDAQMRFNRAKEIADEYGIPFINYNSRQFYEEMQFDFATDMAEWAHMNHRGNVKFTRFLGKRICGEYGLPDRRGDDRWASWERNAEYFWQSMENQALKEQADVISYFGHIADNPSYTTVVSVTGNIADSFEEMAALLEKIGIPCKTYDINRTWVMENQEVVMHYEEGMPRPFIQLDGTNIDFSQGDAVKVDGVLAKPVNHGINVVVYDHVTETVVDTAGFDVHNEFALSR